MAARTATRRVKMPVDKLEHNVWLDYEAKPGGFTLEVLHLIIGDGHEDYKKLAWAVNKPITVTTWPMAHATLKSISDRVGGESGVAFLEGMTEALLEIQEEVTPDGPLTDLSTGLVSDRLVDPGNEGRRPADPPEIHPRDPRPGNSGTTRNVLL